ncbi:hypothetical protein AAFC00_000667 [Neodothiora populina]|uniref:Kinase n=1 Tax=Neodothiora populina TaxID=2781224 RepID=A0ABR3PES3_9PEZI
MSTTKFDLASAVAFEHVAAGQQQHSDGILADPSGILIYKPCTRNEIDFYQTTITEHPDFARLMPTFMGTLERGRSEQIDNLLSISQVADSASPSIVLPTPDLEQNVPNATEESIPLRGRKLDTDLVVVLENTLAGFTRPNFMDIKLGKRLWADDAPKAKRAKFDDIASKTTSGSLGFRVAGMQIWEPSEVRPCQAQGVEDSMTADVSGVEDNSTAAAAVNSTGRYRPFDKIYGRSLREDNVQDAFKELFCLGSDALANEYVEDNMRDVDRSIEEIETVLASKESRMYSASILLVFEGDAQTRKKLIDAAVKRAVEESEGGGDGGGAGGLQADDEDDNDDDEDDEDEEEPRLFDVRVIDFAHAAWTPGQGRDENMLFGIKNVRKIINLLIEEAI